MLRETRACPRGSPHSRGGGKPCKISHGLLECFLPFAKLLYLLRPKLGMGLWQSEFGMGLGAGDWGFEELVVLGDITAGCGSETTGGGSLQLFGKRAGIWGLPNHLKHLQNCPGLKELPHTRHHLHGWWETQRQASQHPPCMGGQSQNPPPASQSGCHHVKYVYF